MQQPGLWAAHLTRVAHVLAARYASAAETLEGGREGRTAGNEGRAPKCCVFTHVTVLSISWKPMLVPQHAANYAMIYNNQVKRLFQHATNSIPIAAFSFRKPQISIQLTDASIKMQQMPRSLQSDRYIYIYTTNCKHHTSP